MPTGLDHESGGSARTLLDGSSTELPKKERNGVVGVTAGRSAAAETAGLDTPGAASLSGHDLTGDEPQAEALQPEAPPQARLWFKNQWRGGNEWTLLAAGESESEGRGGRKADRPTEARPACSRTGNGRANHRPASVVACRMHTTAWPGAADRSVEERARPGT
jgi:hypothetical protein